MRYVGLLEFTAGISIPLLELKFIKFYTGSSIKLSNSNLFRQRFAEKGIFRGAI